VIALFSVLALPAALAQTSPTTFEFEWHAGGEGKADMPAFGWNRHLKTSTIPPAKLEGIPYFEIRYAKLEFADDAKTSFICGISRSSPALPREAYDIFFIDLDRDGRLVEEEILRGTLRKTGRTVTDYHFGALDITLTYDDKPHRCNVFLSRRSFGYGGELYVQSHCYTRGTVRIDDTEFTAVLIDLNCDGRFDGGKQKTDSCDYLWLDFDGDGTCGQDERWYVGGVVQHNGRFLAVSASPDGGKVSIEPYQGELARVNSPFEKMSITLSGPTSPVVLEVNGPVFSLPPGTYTVDNYAVDLAGIDGRTWILRGRCDLVEDQEAVQFDAAPGTTTDVPVGAPISTQVKSWVDDSSAMVKFRWEVFGAAGERLSLSRPDRSPPAPPKIQITGAEDRVVHSTVMEGGTRSADHRWQPEPEMPPGDYSALVLCDSWPIDMPPAASEFEIPASFGDVRGEKTARALTNEETAILATLNRLVKGLSAQYPGERWRHRNPVLYRVRDEDQIDEWLVYAFGRKEGKSEVGFGSSRLEDARGDYYLLDGTPLASRWEPRGDGMFDIRIDVGRSLSEGERAELVARVPFDTGKLLETRDGKRLAIVLYQHGGTAKGIAVRIDKPLELDGWLHRDEERESTEGWKQLVCLLPPSPVDATYLVYFRRAAEE
jgi:hypothetical protein